MNQSALPTASILNINGSNATSSAAAFRHRTLLTDFITAFTALTILATLIFNGLIILAYARHAELRARPFNVYIVSSAVIEVITALIFMPATLTVGHLGYWPSNGLLCSIFISYPGLVFGSVSRYTHVLIAANRLWAVTFPMSYHERHTNRLALAVVILVWLFANAVGVPVVVRGRMGIGLGDADRRCQVERALMYTYSIVGEAIGFVLPEVFILATYPIILYKLRKRRSVQCMRASGVGSASGAQSNDVRRGLRVEPSNAHTGTATSGTAKRTPGTVVRGSESQNRVLAYLIAAMVVCWTPNNVYFLIVDIVPGYWNSTFYAVQFFAQFAHSWLSALLCYLAMGSIRRAVNQTIRCCC
ncbi:hypothetical protein BV898_13285 [Hypsibius exemplaris]|uniref:G-protein coupled receptors family 1 profile domain-containing protein n=1 Tax=Hypsibius exemplaris TaxID=2072580 RepID=A0A1W0WB96_HYPEX|nr:hypothetical protein BV898_13285 [Hypsibius exemplaris]